MAIRNLLAALAVVSTATSKYIVPGARWYDTDGNLFNAHAGGLAIDRDSGKFCWFGEHKTQEQEESASIHPGFTASVPYRRYLRQ